jgi:hypothetical protein
MMTLALISSEVSFFSCFRMFICLLNYELLCAAGMDVNTGKGDVGAGNENSGGNFAPVVSTLC